MDQNIWDLYYFVCHIAKPQTTLYTGYMLTHYLFQVGQTPGRGQVWMSQPQCAVQQDTALCFSPALSQTAY